MEAAIRFVTFDPDSLYELKGLCGATLEMLGGYYWFDKKIGVNYTGKGYRRNGLQDILKLKEEDDKAASIWRILPDGRKWRVIDERPGRIKIDMRSI